MLLINEVIKQRKCEIPAQFLVIEIHLVDVDSLNFIEIQELAVSIDGMMCFSCPD